MKARLFLLGALMLSACAGRNIDIGAGGAGGAGASRGGTTGAGDGQVGPPRAVWRDPNGCVDDAGTSPITGTWKGYIELLPAPWDTIVLDIRGASDTGGVCGTMTVGTGTAPPPPTQRDVGYPLGAAVQGLTPIEGFAYTLLDATLQEGRVRFELGDSQPWREWCALQIPVPDEHADSGYSCTGPRVSIFGPDRCVLEEPGSGKRQEVDCGWLQVVNECQCYADGCEAGRGHENTFDLHFNGDEVDGGAHVLPAPDPNTPKRARFFRIK